VVEYLDLLKQTFTEFRQDKAPRLGAALAYYTIFSIGPVLLIAVAVAGLVFGQEAAQGELSKQLRGLLGPNAASALETMVKNAAKPKTGMFATIVGDVWLGAVFTAVLFVIGKFALGLYLGKAAYARSKRSDD
jgi:membrane protein